MKSKKGCRAHPFSFEDLLFPVLPLEGRVRERLVLPLEGGVRRGPLILIHPSSSGATAVDDEGCVAIRHLEGTGVGAVAFSQGD